MEKDNMSFVAIIGGFWELKNQDPAKFEEAKKKAKEIGNSLAKAGMGFVVYISDDESLEPHVVSGYTAALSAGTGAGSIRVRFSESQKGRVRFSEQATREDLFDPKCFPGNDWEAPFNRSLVESTTYQDK
jgi:hypothetical protein